MAGSTGRVARALMTAGGVALVCASAAGAATAATFKSTSGSMAPKKVSGVTASGGKLAFTGSAKPTGTPDFAGQIDFTTGQATGLSAPGSLKLKHSSKSATLKVTTISGTTLSATLNGKSLSFPLSLSKAKSAPNSTFTGVAVTGVVVNLSSADAKALNSALKTTGFKSGKEFGTLSYNGIDRELIETTGGPLKLCDDKSFDTQSAKNGVVPSAVKPATATTTGCTGANDDAHGINFPENGKQLGFIDTATKTGRITVEGGIEDTQSSSSTVGKFTSPYFYVDGSNSTLSAIVSDNGASLGRVTVATVTFTASPSLTFNEAGGTLSVPADGTTVALNSTGQVLLNDAFCMSTCKGGDYTAGEAIGYSGGTTSFK